MTPVSRIIGVIAYASMLVGGAACESDAPHDQRDTAAAEPTMSVPDIAVATAPDAVVEPVDDIVTPEPDVVAPEPDVVAPEPDITAPTSSGIAFGDGIGDQAEPQTVVHLSFAADANPTDPIVSYLWNVTQPAGSVSVFQPSATVASPSLSVDVAGDYQFDLALLHQSGNVKHLYRSLSVVPESTNHIELLWHTPGDADESDSGISGGGGSVGSDVDLHFALLPDATTAAPDASYFDENLDCYWLGPAPTWTTSAGEEHPTLDRDDTDGAGPENLNVDPLGGRCYAVAVHYWDDWGFGWSTATVRYFRNGTLVFETAADVANRDLWIVGKLCADDLELTPEAGCADATCPPVIIHEFPVPLGQDFPFALDP